MPDMAEFAGLTARVKKLEAQVELLCHELTMLKAQLSGDEQKAKEIMDHPLGHIF